MAIESASPSYWPNESPESAKLSPIPNESMDLTSLSSIPNESLDSTYLSLQPSLESLESNESGKSSPYSQPWSPDSQSRWPDVHPWPPESEKRSSDVHARSPVLQTYFPESQPSQQPVSQSWSPDLRVVPKVMPVSPEPPPILRKGVIGSYSPIGRIYFDDSLDSELPWGDVVPDILDSEGGSRDYCGPESITTYSIAQGDGIDEAYLKALGQFCPAVLKLLDKVTNVLSADTKSCSSLVDSSHCTLTVGVALK
ncbi:hypothetical protein OROHE_020437 [Orobanche hederae]